MTNQQKEPMTTIAEKRVLVEDGRIVVYPEVQSDLVQITPEIAAEWLVSSTGNRRLRRAWIDALALRIRQGKWNPGLYEYIRFNQYGELIDGHHRLSAVIKAGMAVENAVIWGIDGDNTADLDSGLSRTPGDILTFRGVASGPEISAAYRLIRAFDNPGPTMIRNSTKTPNQDLIDFIADEDNHTRIVESIKFTNSVQRMLYKRLRPSVITGLHFILTPKYGQDKVEEFFNSLATGVNLPDRSPILVLRQKLERNLVDRRKMDQEKILLVTIRAFVKYINGENSDRIHEDGAFPKF